MGSTGVELLLGLARAMSSPILALGTVCFNFFRGVVAYSVSYLTLRASQESAGSVPYPRANLQVDKTVLANLIFFNQTFDKLLLLPCILCTM